MLSSRPSDVRCQVRQVLIDTRLIFWYARTKPKEDRVLTQEQRRRTLAAAGLFHPRPESVLAQLFVSGGPFFFAFDKVQVKYEMLLAHRVDGRPVVSAASERGYSRA